MKHCISCGVSKTLDSFYNTRNTCKICTNIKRRHYLKKNTEKVRKQQVDHRQRLKDSRRAKNKQYWLKCYYGLDIEDFNAMRVQQSYCCYICKRHESMLPKGLCVDHCHKTDVVRGLLCVDCNIGLGGFKDSIDNLLTSVEYLLSVDKRMNYVKI